MSPAERIYEQAIKGTPFNPGLPPVLASLLVAQAAHESANFTSNFFLSYCNPFGYSYYAGSNYQVGAGSIADNGAPIAVFSSIENATMEMVDWLYRHARKGDLPPLQSITTPEVYAVALKKAGYYGDSINNYLVGLKRYFRPIAAGLGVGIFIASVALLYAYSRGYF